MPPRVGREWARTIDLTVWSRVTQGCIRGPSMGANGEYVCMPEDGMVAIKQANMTYEEAAAVPFGGQDALHFLRKGNIQSGQKIMINGAGGNIGTFAIQLAKHLGAEVSAVDSTGKLDMLRSIGADQVIDYTLEDFTKRDEIYDRIFDILGKSSFSRCKSSLSQNGRYLLASFKMKQLFQMLWTSMIGSKRVICALAIDKQEDLIFIKELVETGKIKTVIDRRYPLDQAADAHRYIEEGHKKGAVVITVEHNNKT